jgi:hypothetical protein
MQLINNRSGLITLVAAVAFSFAACNKEFEDIAKTPVPTPPTGSTLAALISTDTSYSFFQALLTKAGAGAPAAYGNANLRLTAFVPNNNAFRASGFPSAAAVSGFFTAAQAIGITNYVITPQLLPLESIPTTFPNLQAPTLLNPTAGTPAFNPFVSLSIFPSKRGTGAWVNNVPLVATNIMAANGIIHNPAVLVTPPSTTLWSRISTDADMTYFRAGITRGDSGQLGTARIDSLLNLPIGPNFTVFVPTNLAMQQLLTAQITQALIAQGMPPATAAATAASLASTPAVFSNPLLYSALTAQTVKGLVVYHILGSRAFSVNLPTTTTSVPTLLNGAVASHPGVAVTATFAGPFVNAATVKGVANPTASTILINPTPGTGTSDQHYLNGVLHKINQVLRPQ